MVLACQVGVTNRGNSHIPWYECRYYNIRGQQAAKLKANHERSLQMLKSQERPFSFYGKALAKEEGAKQYKAPTAKDFQRPFKANPIPKSSLEVSSQCDLPSRVGRHM